MHPSLYEALFNRSPTGHYLLSPTAEAIILAVNDAFLLATSRTREELVGVSVFKAFPANPNDSEDSGVLVLRRSLELAIETGTVQHIPVQRYPIAVTLGSGELAYEERYWSAANTPIFDNHGKLVCISHTTTDVTDKVRAETALRESESRLRAYVTATSDVVYRMSPDWAYLHEFDGRGFLRNTTGWAPYQIEDYVPPEDLDLARAAIQEAIGAKAVFHLEHRVFRVDGSCGWTVSRAVPLLGEDGEIVEWIGAASDITERKFAEEKLKDADRRKDEFLAMLAHELRNPLAPISSAAQLLQFPDIDKDRIERTGQIIVRQVKHMTGLVDDLLDVSRVTRGQVVLDPTSLDVRQIVTEAVEQAAPLVQAHRHHVTLHLVPDVTYVWGDKKRLIQVIVNLINNAAKFTPDGGSIAISTEVSERHVVLDIVDNGHGIAPTMLERIFDLFTQVEVSPDRSAGGLGLGLALVKSIVELHGGTVQCQSAGPGCGSRFTVSLPRFKRNALDKPAVGMQPLQHAKQPLRLMVVDDNVDGADMMSMLLGAAGHEVLVETSSKSALERAKVEMPDAFLLDIGLPEMDGRELAERIRAQPENAKAVMIAVTGYGQNVDRQRSVGAGFDHHLVKPVDTTELMEILETVPTRWQQNTSSS